MNKKHHGGPGPVPPGNQPQSGPPSAESGKPPLPNADENPETGFNDQDVKRRLGGYGGAGEHPRQQPSRLNDGGSQNR